MTDAPFRFKNAAVSLADDGMCSATQPSLVESTLTGLQWSYGGRLAQVTSQVAVGILLARILGPAPFGVVAAAWLVVGLANQWADLGLSSALIQRKTVCPEDVRFVFTVQLVIGVGLTVAVAASADLVAQVLKRAELVWVIRALSLVFVIQVFGLVATSLLKRNLDFKTVQLTQTASYVVAYVLVGVPLAAFGLGAWSLVVAQLTQSFLYSSVLFLRVRYSIKPLLSTRPAGLVGFGSKVTAINLVNWFISSVDSAFLARCFGVRELGLYNRACTLTAAPTGGILSALSGVLFPAYSKGRQDNSVLRRVYLTSVAAVALVTLPLFSGVAVAHHSVIEGLYGDRWSAAGPLLVPLALAMVLHALMGLAGPLLWARGRVELELWVQSVVGLLFVLVLLATSRISVLAVAWGVFLVYLVRFLLMTSQVLRITEGSWRSVLAALRGALFMAICTDLLIWSVDRVLLTYGLQPVLRLAPDVVAGAFAMTGFALLFPRIVFGAELAWLLRRFAGRLPAAFRPFVRHIDSVEMEAA